MPTWSMPYHKNICGLTVKNKWYTGRITKEHPMPRYLTSYTITDIMYLLAIRWTNATHIIHQTDSHQLTHLANEYIRRTGETPTIKHLENFTEHFLKFFQEKGITSV